MGVYIELPKDWAKWSLEVTDVHDNILEAKVTDLDLVRCKDCKHYDTESRTFPCCTDIFGAVRYMEADGFCSKGERRADCEDETDEEWYDWRDEQEYEDRWERRADEN